MTVTPRAHKPKTREEAIAIAKAYAKSLTPEEDAALTKAALDDPDSILVTEEFTKGSPGRPFSAVRKIPVSIRLSPDVLDYYRSGGRGWQGRIDEALRKVMQLQDKPNDQSAQVDAMTNQKKRA
ncbi:hypothetical protein B5P45_15545 [Phyllobacterium zundukense]|uniref:Cytoplasmic protein n=2 Tax=Phyllobacterium zundukense TaxID=1867719 RepID=A0A2N9VXC0_9HYPH|nr:hypothetical protein B5P45_15545 [Phyllobacterium zundukense]